MGVSTCSGCQFLVPRRQSGTCLGDPTRARPCCPFPKRATQTPEKKEEIDLLPLPTIGAHWLGSNPVLTFGNRWVRVSNRYIPFLVAYFLKTKQPGWDPWTEVLFIYLFISILWCCSSGNSPITIFSQKFSNIENMKVENPKHPFHIVDNCS